MLGVRTVGEGHLRQGMLTAASLKGAVNLEPRLTLRLAYLWLGSVDAGPLGDHYIWALAKSIPRCDCRNMNVQQENEMKGATENEPRCG